MTYQKQLIDYATSLKSEGWYCHAISILLTELKQEIIMNNLTFNERSDIAIKCLPDSPYKDCLKKLHDEMLETINKLKAEKEDEKDNS